ncbi:FbpB family small basic protein [Peribacillus frigoritolerans]|uniref:FbpB family small basic protein n=1 Tax=Peribacillus frigoritolerans TaxID=450367 RepID=UPI0024DF2C22|nr:FbpB family small basic protein [Peribacillus frigoritolerans]
MSRRRKSYTQLLKENRELLLHDKIEVERIYTKIKKPSMKKRAVSKYNHDWSKFERCLQSLAFQG